MRLTPVLRTLTLVSVLALGVPATGAADEVTDWNAALVGLFPAQSFAADLEASLAKIADDSAIENSTSIARGAAWGKQVAEDILFWRSTDGLDTSPSTFTGSTDVGKWRPTLGRDQYHREAKFRG